MSILKKSEKKYFPKKFSNSFYYLNNKEKSNLLDDHLKSSNHKFIFAFDINSRLDITKNFASCLDFSSFLNFLREEFKKGNNDIHYYEQLTAERHQIRKLYVDLEVNTATELYTEETFETLI